MKITTTEYRNDHINDDYGNQNDVKINEKCGEIKKFNESKEYKLQLVWRNIILMSLLHIIGLYGYIHAILYAKMETVIFTTIIGVILGTFGVTIGAHRLWSHQSFKAKFLLRLMFCVGNCYMLQNDIYDWCRDHRVHHKYTETDADPYNAKRGFFFSHMGWLLVRKHPDVIETGKKIDLSDVWSDPIVRFQRKYYKFLLFIFWFYLPMMLPVWLFGETKTTGFVFCVMFRYLYSLHSAWTVNSFAHMYGKKPYDTRIEARDSRGVVLYTYGEGYHNYHHTFPYDYSASESTWQYDYNLSTLFIDAFAFIGLAYDLKKADEKVVRNRQLRTGSGSPPPKSFLYALFQWILGFALFNAPLWGIILGKLYFQVPLA